MPGHYTQCVINRLVGEASETTATPKGAQSSVVEWTKARVAVCNTEALAPQLDRASRFKSPKRELTSYHEPLRGES